MTAPLYIVFYCSLRFYRIFFAGPKKKEIFLLLFLKIHMFLPITAGCIYFHCTAAYFFLLIFSRSSYHALTYIILIFNQHIEKSQEI